MTRDAYEEDEDVQRMLAFQRGNEQAFVELYERHRNRLANFTRRMMGNVADGEEAAQETFLKLYNVRSRYTAQSRFLTFLFRIATNHCLNIKAGHENTLRAADNAPVDSAASPTASGPEAQTQRAELRAALQKALAALPEKQTAALLLCHYEGLSLHEAALALDVSEGAVKQLLHRARTTLAQTLARENTEQSAHHDTRADHSTGG